MSRCRSLQSLQNGMQICPHPPRVFRQFSFLSSLRPRSQPVVEGWLRHARRSALHGSSDSAWLDPRHVDRVVARHGWIFLLSFCAFFSPLFAQYLPRRSQIRFHLAEQEIKQIGEGDSPAEYTRERAIQSFQQIVEIHGWQVRQQFLHSPRRFIPAPPFVA